MHESKAQHSMGALLRIGWICLGRRLEVSDAVGTHGNDVDLRSVDEISDFDRYDAVVVGSGMYDGSWTAEATELMRRRAAVLARKPVWLFSVGSFGDRHPIVGGLIKKEPKEIREFEEIIHPRDYRVFAEVIGFDYWPTWGRLLFKALGGHSGDNRQWPDIDAWAENIAQELQAHGSKKDRVRLVHHLAPGNENFRRG